MQICISNGFKEIEFSSEDGNAGCSNFEGKEYCYFIETNEITNTGVTTGSTTYKQICSTVVSEGGYDRTGSWTFAWEPYLLEIKRVPS